MSKLTKGYGSTSIQKILTDLKTYLIGKFALKTNIPTKVSDLTNDSGFITKIVDDLVNYYLKSEIYSKSEVDALVTAIKNSRFESVNTLPTEDIKTNVIYLVPSSDPQASNIKDEYINLDGTTMGWEKIGSTDIDLSGYVTTAQLNTALANYVTSTNLTTILADYATTTSVTSALESKVNTADLGTAASKNSTNAVTSGSTALVESGAVYTALSNKTDNTIVSDIESTTTASKAYAVDEYLMLNNNLYKVTSAISSGGTIVTSGANANVVAVKITDEIGQGGGGADLTILAPEFNTTTTYGVGDYVTYDGSLYRFTSAHSAGAWNSNRVVEIKAVGQYVTAGKKSGTTLGDCATAEGNSTEASGKNSHAEGYFTKARGNNSHAEGDHTIASGAYSHAEGNMTTASGAYSHAEGDHTIANTDSSHAEGNMTTASGAYSHAEGEYTVASGRCSHAEGRSTASGAYSHAEGYATKAQRKSQTAIGEYNVADTTGADGTVKGKYAFIIGNGTSDNTRSNALTVDWDGNLEVAGSVNGANLPKYITSQTFTGNTYSGTLYTFAEHPTEIVINFKMNGPGAYTGRIVIPIMIDYTREVIYAPWSDRDQAYLVCTYSPNTKVLRLDQYRYDANDDHYGIRLDVYAK